MRKVELSAVTSVIPAKVNIWMGVCSRYRTAVAAVISDEVIWSSSHRRLTHCILVDSSTIIFWTSPFVILGVSGLFCRFDSIF